jgi:two-component system chemotaxis response regulator CheY
MKQVLIVDDSPVIRKVTRRIFEGLQIQASEAEDGQQALEACTFLMPDVIFVDWHMPRMDGFDFLKELRRMPGGSQPKVLFCISENDVAPAARARHCGADDIILKPFDRRMMEEKIAEMGILDA